MILLSECFLKISFIHSLKSPESIAFIQYSDEKSQKISEPTYLDVRIREGRIDEWAENIFPQKKLHFSEEMPQTVTNKFCRKTKTKTMNNIEHSEMSA